jgi:hypothetical protein
MRKIRATRIEGADSAAQIREDTNSLIVPAILTRESILPFCEGQGYRSADELKASAYTLEGAWVVSYGHIDSVFVMDREDIRGQVENVHFDATGNAVKGEIHFFKSACDQAFLEGVKAGSLKDVSVAYYCEEDFTPGQFASQPYDFVQRNFMFGHVAAGVPEGRCPSPFCGMGCDSFKVKPRTEAEVAEGFVRIQVRQPDLFAENSFRTIVLSVDEGINAVIGKLKTDPQGTTLVQNYTFDVSKDWNLEKSQAWVKQHKNEQDAQCDCCVLDPNSVLARSRRLLVSR